MSVRRLGPSCHHQASGVLLYHIGGARLSHPALAKAGLRRIRLHDLRHTFASLLIQNSESLAYVRDQLGHHSIQITVDTYGHLVPGANRQAVARLDEDVLTTYCQKAGCV